jgi:2-polyprenyl-3-methyl-5-hydroxy-6-metoxy-1,4-benzoquinol methylase
MHTALCEKELQEHIPWERAKYFPTYNDILGHYQIQACLEHAKFPALLDLACGDGLLTALAAPHFQRVVGVDAAAVHLAAARERLPGVEFHESLIEDLALGETFDSIFMLNILEHVLDPVLVLRQAAQFLKEDGVLIVQVPNAHAINRKIAVAMGTLTGCEELSPFDINIAGHRRSYTLATLMADIARAGLPVQAVGGVFYKMLSTAQMDWFLENGLWAEGGFGWGRVGATQQDWRARFCQACYDLGKERPEDCNVIYAVITHNPGK